MRAAVFALFAGEGAAEGTKAGVGGRIVLLVPGATKLAGVTVAGVTYSSQAKLLTGTVSGGDVPNNQNAVWLEGNDDLHALPRRRRHEVTVQFGDVVPVGPQTRPSDIVERVEAAYDLLAGNRGCGR